MSEPLTEEEVRAYGFALTEDGWVPLSSRRRANLADAEWHRTHGYDQTHRGCILFEENPWRPSTH